MDGLKPYKKLLERNAFAICAIYEPHPFRSGVIEEAIKNSGRIPSGSTAVADDNESGDIA